MSAQIRKEEDWEKMRSAIEKENLDDPGTFSRMLKSYLSKVEQLHNSYQAFCKKIFPPG
jgi:hypothetical protein